MALVLPALRLWLLFLNVYGTFKVIKPPAPSSSTKSNRNGQQGLSTRALQLRKRELKSRLAMWIVGACFFASESVLDRTAGLLTPFYNELKCVALLFLLITRSHGAEAIFLHLIHPFIRPYVPAVDNILAHLHSVFELLVLLSLIPFEYVSEWWARPWKLPHIPFFRHKQSRDPISDHHSAATTPAPPEESAEVDNQFRSRLRPPTQYQKSQLHEAEQHAKIVFDQIDEAQDRVRVRTRSVKGQNQPQAPVNKQPNGNGRPATGTGLRTRKNFLGQSSSVYASTNPGSKSTGVHHLDPLAIAQLAKTKPTATSTLDNDRASVYSFPLTTSARQHAKSPENAHDFWIPPSYDKDRESTPQAQSRQSSHRSPSPIAYPPFPSAYPFTPRRKTEPSQTLMPNEPLGLQRRSTSPGPTQNADSKRKHPIPSSPSSSNPQYQESRASDGLYPEDFFQPALESSTRPPPDTMDVDTITTETLSTLNDSSATEDKSMYEDTPPLNTVTVKRRRNNNQSSSRKDETESLKRSLRLRTSANGKTTTPRDEFGFSIPKASSAPAIRPVPKVSQRPGPGRHQPAITYKKSLARAKPALNSDGEMLSDDAGSENVKKKRKMKRSPVKKRSSRLEPLENENESGEDYDEPVGGKGKAGSRKARVPVSRTIDDTDASVSFRASRDAMKEVAHSLKAAKRAKS